ncbi:MAG: IPT/TIG domain-containing protein, partial [Spirochaetaceae bacterium]|nr:IPT/TIG domain-containing protein [Spirochaetaceae bacterium]
MWRKAHLPLAVFGVCLILLAVSLWRAGRGPEVLDIQPHIAEPGDVLSITGSNFGEAPGRVSIAGVLPVASAYLAWTPHNIRVRIPGDASSGLVYVITEKGQSEGILFTNRNDIPVVLRGAQEGPHIKSISPGRSAVGTLITVNGTNFGYNREDSLVLFTWSPAAEAGSAWADPHSRYIAASAEAFDYERWSDTEISVRVPTGAGSGAMMVRTARGESNTVHFELDQSAGRRFFRDKRSYTFSSSIDVRNTSRKDGGSLYLWIPRIQESPIQRNVEFITEEPSAEIENYNGLMLFCFREPKRGVSYKIEQTFRLDRYATESRIDPARMPVEYDTERPLYKAYTSSNEFTPAADPEITAAMRANGGREDNPYLRARLLYNFVLARLGYSAELKYRSALEGMKTRTGDAYTYATLYVTLLRSAGIP